MRLTSVFCFVVSVGLTHIPSFTEAVTKKFDYPYRNLFEFSKMAESATNYLESEVRETPTNTKLRFSLATLYYWQKMVPQAKRQFEETITTNPKDAEAHFHLGILYLEDNNSDQFIEHMKKTISLNPLYVKAYNGLAWIYTVKGEYDLAKQILEVAQTRNSKDESVYFNHAILLGGHFKDKWENVVSDMNHAIGLNPREEYYFILGTAYLHLERYVEARTAARKALELNPKNVYALLIVATTYKEMTEFERALEIAEQARALEPANKDIQAEIQEYKEEYEKWKESKK